MRDRSGKERALRLVTALTLLALSRVLADSPEPEGHALAAQTEPSHDGPAGAAPRSDPHAGHQTGSEKAVNTYSLFMHHAAGVGLILVGLLLSAHRLTGQRFAVLRAATGATWFLLGLFLFIRSDPEGWPIGPAGFRESFTMPTRAEWIQHKLLAMIPMFMGFYAGMVHRHVPSAVWTYAAVGLAVLGGLGLTEHQHLNHPGTDDIVNAQHRFFAATALFIAGSLVLDRQEQLAWRIRPYLLPIGLTVLGLQLAFYAE